MIYNIITSLSNFSILFFYKLNNNIIIIPMIASFIYHLSETKHNLPGLYPLNLISNFLLNIDRICAFISALKIICKLYYNPKIINFNFLFCAIIGLFCLFLSECDVGAELLLGPNSFKIDGLFFVIPHNIWYFCAFYCLNKVF